MSNKENKPGFLSLVQGQQYQSKKKHTNKKGNNLREGFVTSAPNIDVSPIKPVLINEYTRMKTTNIQNQKDLSELQKLQSQYNDLLTQYKNLTNQIKTDTLNNMDKISLSNPYLDKNITLSNIKGALPIIGSAAGGYVTSQGIFKSYPDENIMNATIGKNGCPTDFVKNVQLDKYSKLLSQGTDMISGQSCGNENTNVYVTNLNSAPTASYIGCYNNSPDTLSTNIVPIMNSTNSVNGFVSSASSVYQTNNTTFGPWAAFDQDINTFWHSNYPVYSNGQYTGTNTMSVKTSDGSTNIISGESLTITLPTVFTLTSYDIQGRQDCCGNSPMTANGRNPNSWYIVGFNSSNNTWNQVDYQQTTNYNISKLTFKIANPQPYNAYAIIIVTVGDNSAPADMKTCVQIASWNLYTNSNTNSAETNGMIDSGLGATTVENCQNYAIDNGYQYYAMQKLQSGGAANCMVSNDKTQIIAYGQPEKKLNMVPLWASNTSGTDYKSASLSTSGQITLSNSSGKTMVVNTSASSDSTDPRLMLFPDGNMYIFVYKNRIGNTIFSSGTSGKQQNKNSNWVASKGKYGQPYLTSGQVLNANEWIGSTDGTLQLIMQTDGNLVLYTSTTIEGCVLDKNTNKMFGNDNINAVYQINNVGYSNNLGNVGYIDGNTVLHQYPSSMLGYSDQYNIYDNYTSTGNDISQIQVNDINACKEQCNSYQDNKCGGFVFEKGSNICYLKDAGTYPKSKRQYSSGFSLGVRTPTILNTNTNTNTKMVEIDSIQYQNYPKGDDMTPDTNFNVPVINENIKNQILQVQNQLTSVASHIANKMEEMYNQDRNVISKMNMNDEQFKKQILMYRTVSMKENEIKEGFQNISIDDINGLVKDTDLHVLQENYGYIFWSILAVGLLTVTFHVMRRT